MHGRKNGCRRRQMFVGGIRGEDLLHSIRDDEYELRLRHVVRHAKAGFLALCKFSVAVQVGPVADAEPLYCSQNVGPTCC